MIWVIMREYFYLASQTVLLSNEHDQALIGNAKVTFDGACFIRARAYQSHHMGRQRGRRHQGSH